MDRKSAGLIGAVAAFVVCDGTAGGAQAYVFSADPLRAQSYAELVKPTPKDPGGRVQLANFFYPDPDLYRDDPWVVRQYHPRSHSYRHRHHDVRRLDRRHLHDRHRSGS
jgi:hypothetical protein